MENKSLVMRGNLTGNFQNVDDGMQMVYSLITLCNTNSNVISVMAGYDMSHICL